MQRNIGLVSDWFVIIFLRVAGFAGSLWALICAFLGFSEIYRGLHHAYSDGKHDFRTGLIPSNSKPALQSAISGLEFLLLAPLAFLLVRSLAEYVEDLHDDNTVSSTTKECLIDAKSLSTGLLFAVLATHFIGKLIAEHNDPHPVKAAVAVVESAGKKEPNSIATTPGSLKPPGVQDEGGKEQLKPVENKSESEHKSLINPIEATVGCVLMVILGIYFFGLEMLSYRTKYSREHTGTANKPPWRGRSKNYDDDDIDSDLDEERGKMPY